MKQHFVKCLKIYMGSTIYKNPENTDQLTSYTINVNIIKNLFKMNIDTYNK